jgi:hypothetical protein
MFNVVHLWYNLPVRQEKGLAMTDFVTVRLAGGEKTFAEFGQDVRTFGEFVFLMEVVRDEASFLFSMFPLVDSLDVFVTSTHGGTVHSVAVRDTVTSEAHIVQV